MHVRKIINLGSFLISWNDQVLRSLRNANIDSLFFVFLFRFERFHWLFNLSKWWARPHRSLCYTDRCSFAAVSGPDNIWNWLAVCCTGFLLEPKSANEKKSQVNKEWFYREFFYKVLVLLDIISYRQKHL